MKTNIKYLNNSMKRIYFYKMKRMLDIFFVKITILIFNITFISLGNLAEERESSSKSNFSNTYAAYC